MLVFQKSEFDVYDMLLKVFLYMKVFLYYNILLQNSRGGKNRRAHKHCSQEIRGAPDRGRYFSS